MYGLVAYIASGPHLRSPWLRLLIAAPVCAMPLAYTQVNNDLVTVQFFGLYGAFWTVLWIPGTRAGRILSPVVMADRVLDGGAERRVRPADRRQADRRPVQERLVPGHRVGHRRVAPVQPDHPRQGPPQLSTATTGCSGCSALPDPRHPAGAVRRAVARRVGSRLPRVLRTAARDQRCRPRCPDRRRVADRAHRHRLAAARFTDPNWTLAGRRGRVQRGRSSSRKTLINMPVSSPLRDRARLCCSTRRLSPSAASGQARGARAASVSTRCPLASRRRVRRAARGRGYAQLPGDQRPDDQPGRGPASWPAPPMPALIAPRHGVYVCARMVVGNNPLQQGRVK